MLYYFSRSLSSILNSLAICSVKIHLWIHCLLSPQLCLSHQQVQLEKNMEPHLLDSKHGKAEQTTPHRLPELSMDLPCPKQNSRSAPPQTYST